MSLEFEGVFQEAEVFLNGLPVGTHRGGYTGFSVDLTRAIREGENLLAVRVNNLWNPQLSPRAGEHIFSGGIYRDVSLVIKNAIHFPSHGLHWKPLSVSRERATISACAEIRNTNKRAVAATLSFEVIDPWGTVLSQALFSCVLHPDCTTKLEHRLPDIVNPQLWHPDHPNLYQLHARLLDKDTTLDECTVPIGIRWFEWTRDRGFFLNGEHLYLRGANLHQDQSGWGVGITQAAIRRDVQLMKDAGFNFIRGAHYPHHPAFSRACDEIGMLLWCELPFWGKGGFGPEGYWNSSAYPAEEKDFAGFERSCCDTLEEMIRIHRNHPSIVAWSMTNEAFFTYNIEEAKNLIRKLVDLTHQLDASRPAAIGGAQRGGFDRIGDLAGYNGDGAKLFIDPGVPNMVSEYGAISKPPDAYQPFFGDLHAEKFAWRSGEAIWCGADYGTIAGKQGLKGIVDHARVPKRSWFWYRNTYRGIAPPDSPTNTLATHLKLEASSTIIHGTDAIDDSQIVVSVRDANGQVVNATPPITFSIESGPGEFPTGRSITFDPATDITYSQGIAAIAFRSYHGGESVIRATSPGLLDAVITITTIGEPQLTTEDSLEVPDRPYVPPPPSEACLAAMRNAVNVARDRPCRASSENPEHPARLANDANEATHWQATRDDSSPFWQVDLEGFYQLSSLRIAFIHTGNYRFIFDVSVDGTNWQQAIDRSASVNTARVREDVFAFGIVGRHVRITCVHNPAAEPFGIAELALYGVLSLR